ncbi:MAG: MGMT family protein [Verrucomicrobia bacterium]|nr:MGMT family protein [Verrucomicrobiota bacterium]
MKGTFRFEWEGESIVQIHIAPAREWQLIGATPLIESWFEHYLKGEEGPPLPLAWDRLSPFDEEVLNQVAEIPFGSTLSYGEVARRCGRPKGARAVGGACGRNPFPLVIPCHRVVASNGIGGFAFALELKESLLNWEAEVASLAGSFNAKALKRKEIQFFP